MHARLSSVLLIAAAALLAAAALAPAALAKPKAVVEVTRIETNTAGNHHETVKAGATVASCESDPIYAVTFFYRWSGLKVPGTERVRVQGPGHTSGGGSSSLFESHGNNASLATAEEFEIGSKALPAGSYRFQATLDGITRKAQIGIRDSGC